VARVIKEQGKALILELSPRHPNVTSSDFPTAFRSTQQWINAFEENRLKLRESKGVEFALFLGPLYAVKKRIQKCGTMYSTVGDKAPSLKDNC